MNNKANPTLIGLFVVTGVALLVMGTLFFATTSWFSRQESFVMYFAGSVNGLEQGSPVKFKGVKIGEVTDIRINYNQIETNETYMPVFIQINQDVLQQNVEGPVDLSSDAGVEYSIKRGLRAKLETESILTGKLYVDLDIHPNAAEPVFLQRDMRLKEIPTMSTALAKLVKSLGNVDLEQFTDRVGSILARVDNGLEAIQFEQINDNMVGALNSLEDLISTPEIKGGLKSVQAMADDVAVLIANVDSEIKPISKKVQLSMAELTSTLDEAQLVFRDLHGLMAPDSPLGFRMAEVMSEFGATARSIRILADYFTRNPRALITGKQLPVE